MSEPLINLGYHVVRVGRLPIASGHVTLRDWTLKNDFFCGDKTPCNIYLPEHHSLLYEVTRTLSHTLFGYTVCAVVAAIAFLIFAYAIKAFRG